MRRTSPIPLLVNPKAGSLFRSGFREWLREYEGYFALVDTKSAADAKAKTHALAEQGASIVAVAGGDGTLMNAAAGLMGSATALGILPCGTMNVFSRELGIGSRRFDVALDAMLGGVLQEVDIFCVNDMPFLQMAGFGLDARVVQLVTPSLKKRMGAAAHVVTALQVMTERVPCMTLTLPTGEQLSGAELILGNGRRYGGEARLFADARFDDGLMDAAMFSQEGVAILLEILCSMLQLGATERNTTDITRLRRFSEAVVTAQTDVAFQLDGDYAGTLRAGESATIRRRAERLRVCVPREPVPMTPVGRMMAHPTIEALLARVKKIQRF